MCVAECVMSLNASVVAWGGRVVALSGVKERTGLRVLALFGDGMKRRREFGGTVDGDDDF